MTQKIGSILLVVLLIAGSLHPVAAEPTRLRRVDALELIRGVGTIALTLVDRPRDRIYYITADAPAKVVRVRLSDFTWVDTIPLLMDEWVEQIFFQNGGLIDADAGFAYLATSYTPPGLDGGRLYKFSLPDFRLVDMIHFRALGGVRCSLLDAARGYAYFALTPVSGVVKVRLSDFEVEDTLLFLGEPEFKTAILDPIHQYAYFADRGIPGRIVKINLATFQKEGPELVLPSGRAFALGSGIDSVNQAGFFAHYQDVNPPPPFPEPARIMKVDLTQMREALSIETNPRSDHISTLMYDSTRRLLYATFFGSGVMEPQVLRLRPSDLSQIGIMSLPSRDHYTQVGMIDEVTGTAYYGSYHDPALVFRVPLDPFGPVTTLPPGGFFEYGDRMTTGVLHDSRRGFGYFLTPDRLVRVRLADMARMGHLDLTGGQYQFFRAAVMDPAMGTAYLAQDRILTKINLCDLSPSGSFDTGGENIIAGVISEKRNYGFFVVGRGGSVYELLRIRLSDLSPAGRMPIGFSKVLFFDLDQEHVFVAHGFELPNVTKIRISTFEPRETIQLPRAYFASTFVSDPVNDTAYIFTDTPGNVHQIRLSTLSILNSRPSPDLLYSAAFDSANQYAYLTQLGFPGVIQKFNVQTLSSEGEIRLDSHERRANGIFLDPIQKIAYTGTYSNPGRVVRLEMANATPLPFSVGTDRLQDGVVGRDYDQPLLGKGGTPLYRWRIQSGTLPAGLQLLPQGHITGRPTAAGSFPVTLEATDSASRVATQPLQLTVHPSAPVLRIDTGALPDGTVGSLYNQTLSAQGVRPFTWWVESGRLPTGLSISPEGIISGSPTEAAPFGFTVRVTDNGCPVNSMTQALSIRINPAAIPPPSIASLSPSSGPYSGRTTVQINGTGFQRGAEVKFGEGDWQPAEYLSSQALQVVTPPRSPGRVHVSVRNPDGHLHVFEYGYTYLPGPAIYRPLPVDSGPEIGGTSVTINGIHFGTDDRQIRVEFDGVPGTVSSVQDGRIVALSPPHAAGLVPVTVIRTNYPPVTVLNAFTYLQGPRIQRPLFPSRGSTIGGNRIRINGSGFGTVRGDLTVKFGGVDATIISAFDAFIIAETNGHAAGLVDVSVSRRNWGEAVLQNAFTFITPPVVRPPLQPAAGPPGGLTDITINGENFGAIAGELSVFFGGARGTIRSLSDQQIVVRTPPHAPGLVDVLVRRFEVGETTETGAYTYGDAPLSQPPRIQTTALGNGLLGSAYPTTRLNASGGELPLEWSVDDPATFVPGLSLAVNGTLSGTPSRVGTYRFIIKVKDALTRSDAKEFALRIDDPLPAPSIRASSLPSGRVGQNYPDTALQITGGRSPLIWSIVDARAFVPGLRLGSNGTISGQPQIAGRYIFSVRVQDTSDRTDTREFNITILEASGPDLPPPPLPDSAAPPAKPRPNPLDFSKGQNSMVFGGLVPDSELRFYSVTGALILEAKADANGEFHWLGNDKDNDRVSTGVYIAKVKTLAGEKTFRVAVQR